jgi:hypothetical protein
MEQLLMYGFAVKQVLSKSKTQSTPANKYRVTSLDKALLVLELLIDRGRDLSITEICQKLGIVKGRSLRHRLQTTASSIAHLSIIKHRHNIDLMHNTNTGMNMSAVFAFVVAAIVITLVPAKHVNK